MFDDTGASDWPLFPSTSFMSKTIVRPVFGDGTEIDGQMMMKMAKINHVQTPCFIAFMSRVWEMMIFVFKSDMKPGKTNGVVNKV